MDFLIFLLRIMLALALGGLIGIDRQKNKKGYPAGIRTLAFISLLGFLSSFVSTEINNSYFLIISFLLMFVLLIVGYGVSFNSKYFFGFTSTIIMFLTFLIGVISFYEQFYYFAVSLSIIISLLLSQKTFIHSLVSNIKDNELFDALKFGIIAFIILPLLPNKTIDPFNVINPYSLWLLVVLILSISYLGYLLSKFLGKNKGIYISGFIGGIISSTAVSSSLSLLSKKNESLTDSYVIGITLGNIASVLMILIEAFLVNTSFGVTLILPLISYFILGLIISFVLIKKVEKRNISNADLISESPFNFLPAIKFTLLIAIILYISKIALMIFGNNGIYAVSFFSSFASTTSVIVTISTLVKESITSQVAWISVAICILVNNLFKLFLIKKNGSKTLFISLLKNYLIMNIPLITWLVLLII
ncbi:MAG: DUF4010 domain-containing protein [Candidatus Nanoarchaeia archaeon]|nr:DUF4010 domain-containing protein [Candidatus Nanoarchaeia archaeon]